MLFTPLHATRLRYSITCPKCDWNRCVSNMSKFARAALHRKCQLQNLVTNVLEHESIVTTHSKAKAVRPLVQNVIDSARRMLSAAASAEEKAKTRELLMKKLYKPDQIMPKLEQIARWQPSTDGSVRILKLEPRLGDKAPNSIIELTNGHFDMLRSLTARAVARSRATNEPLPPYVERNMTELTRTAELRSVFEKEVEKMNAAFPKHENVDLSPLKVAKRAPIEIAPNPLTT